MSTETIELIVDKALAKAIKEKGLAEIVLRQKNARFKSMVKCSLPSDTSEKVLEKALEKTSEHIDAKKIRKGLADLRNATNSIDSKLSLFTNSIDNISDSVTSLAKATNVVKAVSFLNVAMTGISIVTTAAGIAYLSMQLNEIKNDLQTVTQGIEKLTNIEKSKMTEQYNELALKILNLSQKIADKERVPLHVYEDLLAQLNPFILKLVENAKDDSFPLMDIMRIIIHLLPAYTMVLEEYTKAYYAEKEKVPAIQGHYASLYVLNDRLASQRSERLEAEKAREKAERDRLQAENAKNEAESSRYKAEKARDKAESEVEKVYDSLDEELTALQRQVNELSRANEIKEYENQALRAKLAQIDEKPVLLQGEEEELYAGEIKDMVLELIDEAIPRLVKNSRRDYVLRDILESNQYERLSEEKKREVKRILKGYSGMSGSVRSNLQDLGFTISEDGKPLRIIISMAI